MVPALGSPGLPLPPMNNTGTAICSSHPPSLSVPIVCTIVGVCICTCACVRVCVPLCVFACAHVCADALCACPGPIVLGLLASGRLTTSHVLALLRWLLMLSCLAASKPGKYYCWLIFNCIKMKCECTQFQPSQSRSSCTSRILHASSDFQHGQWLAPPGHVDWALL